MPFCFSVPQQAEFLTKDCSTALSAIAWWAGLPVFFLETTHTWKVAWLRSRVVSGWEALPAGFPGVLCPCSGWADYSAGPRVGYPSQLVASQEPWCFKIQRAGCPFAPQALERTRTLGCFKELRRPKCPAASQDHVWSGLKTVSNSRNMDGRGYHMRWVLPLMQWKWSIYAHGLWGLHASPPVSF
jgi:hypothetical protein